MSEMWSIDEQNVELLVGIEMRQVQNMGQFQKVHFFWGHKEYGKNYRLPLSGEMIADAKHRLHWYRQQRIWVDWPQKLLLRTYSFSNSYRVCCLQICARTEHKIGGSLKWLSSDRVQFICGCIACFCSRKSWMKQAMQKEIDCCTHERYWCHLIWLLKFMVFINLFLFLLWYTKTECIFIWVYFLSI